MLDRKKYQKAIDVLAVMTFFEQNKQFKNALTFAVNVLSDAVLKDL